MVAGGTFFSAAIVMSVYEYVSTMLGSSVKLWNFAVLKSEEQKLQFCIQFERAAMSFEINRRKLVRSRVTGQGPKVFFCCLIGPYTPA